MASESASRTLTDHDDIRSWAKNGVRNPQWFDAHMTPKVQELFDSIFQVIVEKVRSKKLDGTNGSGISIETNWRW